MSTGVAGDDDYDSREVDVDAMMASALSTPTVKPFSQMPDAESNDEELDIVIEGEELDQVPDMIPFNEEQALYPKNDMVPVPAPVPAPRSSNFERRALLNQDDSEDYGRYGDNSNSGHGMDESRVRLKKRMSFLEKMQSMFIKPDEQKEKLLPQDTFSMMIIAETWTLPFTASLIIFTLQVTIFVLTLLDLAREGEPGNAFGVPANVSAELRATQFIAVLVAVLTQGDLRTASILLRDGFNKDFDTAFMETAPWKFHMSIAARTVSGSIGLLVSFVLIITAPSVVELLLNFTAIEFVSSIDELCFFLSKQGFLGSRCKTEAMTIANTLYKVDPQSRMGCFRRSWKTVSLFVILFVFLAGWVIIVAFQLSGKYVCDTIMVQMGDDFVPALGTFNGLYDLESPGNYVPLKERRVKYVERRSSEISTSGRGLFEYCGELQSWTFRWESTGDDKSDPCDWVARSSETKTYDITETVGEPWLVRDSPREVVLEPFRLFCFDCENEGQENSDDCGGNGSCSNAVCECEEGWYGLRCEFASPCNALAIDARTEEFASTRDWSSNYQTLELESGSLVESYSRPVFIHEYNSGEYDVVMFTGRRWALTSSEFLPRNGRISDDELLSISEEHEGLGSEIGNFFHYIFHGYKGFLDDFTSEEYSVAFLSDFMDFTTHSDASSPVGFQWFRAVPQERTGDDENQGPAREVDTQFLCRICNNSSNPCLYDGMCVDGSCQCSLDSFGSLCEIPPVRNGHCDPFFNTPEFKMDGGDCCESTCVSTTQYICGAEENGYVSTGYFSCELPADEWQEDPLNGEAGSFSGFDLDLSLRSVVVAELLQDRVRVYDKVGSSWELRDSIQGEPGTRFGTSVALSSGPYNVVSNPSFLAPLTVAVLDGYRNLRLYKCTTDGCDKANAQVIPLVYGFDLSDDGTVVATTGFKLDRSPPSQITVYESNTEGVFVSRTSFNITKNNTALASYSMSLSGDGKVLAVQNQAFQGGVATHDFFDVRVWNGVSYELESEFRFVGDFNAYAYSLSLSLSQDGSVLAYGIPDCRYFQLNVFSRDEENKWAARVSPPLNTTQCVQSDRPERNNNLALSRDGSMLAYRLGISVSAFQWESEAWSPVGDTFPLKSYPIAISADGTELAIGSPEEGIGGISTVYSLPGTKQCPSGQSLLRVSLTLDRQPDSLVWDIKNNETGDVLYREGRYPVKDYAFGTIVEEKCVDTDACYVFTIYDLQNLGLQAPGQYALFLDGEDVGRGSVEKLYEKVYFGDCSSCPEGMEMFSMVVLTCGPISWGLLELVDEGAPLQLQIGDTMQTFTDSTTYTACDFDQSHDGNVCNNPVETYVDTCLDPTKCYAVTVRSPNKAISYVEIHFDGVKTKGDVIPICSGSSLFAGNSGNPDQCLVG